MEIRSTVRSSYLHNGISYTDKMASLYWDALQLIFIISFIIPHWHMMSLWWCVNKGVLIILRFQKWEKNNAVGFIWWQYFTIHSSPPGQNGHHFTDKIFICILLNENIRISIRISLRFIPKSPTDNKWLVQVRAWCWKGDKSLPAPVLTQSIDAYMQH